jgi:hypothetical protein
MMRERTRLTWAEVCARRLDRQWLAAPARGVAMAEVVGAMCGAHAQVMSAAEVSIGIRMAGVTREHVRSALWRERSLVKTRGPRGTVHVLPAHELALWTGALAALPSDGNDLLTDSQVDAAVAAIERVLVHDEMTPDEMDAGVIATTGPWAADPIPYFHAGSQPRWRWAIGAAMSRGVLCFGPSRGTKVTYTSTRRWLPGFAPAEGPTALRWLALRYLHGYGPAAPASFAQWLAAPRRWAIELFASMAEERAIEEVDVDGLGTAWVAAGDTSGPPAPPRAVRLLPYFDAYAVGCHPRELVFPGRAAERALARNPRHGRPTGGQAGNFPVLLVDGVVAGVWHAVRSGSKMAITVEPFVDLSAEQSAELARQAERVGEVAEARSTLAIGRVSAGPHA